MFRPAATRRDGVLQGRWRRRVLQAVSRRSGERGYYLVELVDRQGRSMMAASIGTEGWLRAVGDARGQQPIRSVALGNAVPAVAQRRGAAAVRAARDVSRTTTIEAGLAEVAPVVAVERFDGTYYVDSAGHVFKEEADHGGPFGSKPATAIRGRVRALERLD
jgi:hypothetical protein